MFTLPLLVVTLFLQVKFHLRPGLKYALYASLIISALHAIFIPLKGLGDFVTYTNAFMSVSFIIRAVELLLLQNLDELMHLEKVSQVSSSILYSWEPVHKSLGYRRFLQVCNLIANPRAIGWNHGSTKYLPPLRPVEGEAGGEHCFPEHQNMVLIADGDRRSFLLAHIWTVVMAYLTMDTYQAAFARNYTQICNSVDGFLNKVMGLSVSPATSEMMVRRYLLSPGCWIASYAFVDGIHSAIGVFSVGILRVFGAKYAGEPWMYPPVFGSVRHLLAFNLRDIWGKMWHDLCRNPFLTLSRAAIIPLKSIPVGTQRFLVICLTFFVSGVVHVAGTYAVSQDVCAVGMMMTFFCILPLCIAAQHLLSDRLLPLVLPHNELAQFVIWLVNMAFVTGWGHTTSPWFLDHSKLPEAIGSVPLPMSLWKLMADV
ncbi:wax synthase family protein [Aspergillus saccharolyticus JOP 1030-1]|uniref:Wax synthase domain-containing protein n=1 Tax=Aspergillus saccharolyticus JOP 1030-1 TaxID=1450539 RepID=A0A318ZBU2_9EURO|nr:hypothetical protein BP01DRAFT_400087 [Aspergillus saccharolyticus JOP 1030-1]PYH44779.1 hypothetical protein BP01DRAFT_400087 [Aspergillus saccharolyticus JOP 1030-1]